VCCALLRCPAAVYVSTHHQVGDVAVLVNNAGIVTGKSLLDAPDHMMELTMKVNAMAHFWTIKAFLPGEFVLERQRSHPEIVLTPHCRM